MGMGPGVAPTCFYIERERVGGGGATDSHQVAVGAAALSGGSQLRQGVVWFLLSGGPLCCSLKPLS